MPRGAYEPIYLVMESLWNPRIPAITGIGHSPSDLSGKKSRTCGSLVYFVVPCWYSVTTNHSTMQVITTLSKYEFNHPTSMWLNASVSSVDGGRVKGIVLHLDQFRAHSLDYNIYSRFKGNSL